MKLAMFSINFPQGLPKTELLINTTFIWKAYGSVWMFP